MIDRLGIGTALVQGAFIKDMLGTAHTACGRPTSTFTALWSEAFGETDQTAVCSENPLLKQLVE